MEELSSVALALALFGGAHDFLTKRIPNWFTFPAMLIGVIAQGWLHGAHGAGNGALGLCLGFALLFPMHAFGYMGAGDVKLLMVVGAWMGWEACFYVTMASVIFGAAYAFVEIIYRGRLRAVVWNTYSFLRALLVPGLEVEKLRVDEKRKFAFGVCIALGVAAVIYLRQRGGLI